MDEKYSKFKYYKGEKECPYEPFSTKGKLWYGEKVFYLSEASLSEWVEEGRRVKKEMSPELLKKANRYDDDTFGIIIYINDLYQKMSPMNDLDFIFDY